MSVSRPRRGCPLCAPELAAADHDAIVACARERGRSAAVVEAARLGLNLDAAAVKAHLQYHRPGQASPHGRLKPEEALARVSLLPERLRVLLCLLGRVPGLSGSQLAELLYWHGADNQLAAARSACYRDLARLVREGFVWRHYPGRLVGPGGSPLRARQHQLSFYFLARDAVPYVEATEQRSLRRGHDWIGGSDELPNEFELFARHARTLTVSGLAAEAARLRVSETSLTLGGEQALLRFSPRNWFSGELLRLPRRDGSTYTPAALAAFSAEFPGRATSLLLPFLVEFDDPAVDVEQAAERLLAWHELKRTEALATKLPGLAKAGQPPVLCFCANPWRLDALRQTAQRLAARHLIAVDLPPIALADRASLAAGALARPLWVSLWDTGNPPRAHTFAEILLGQASASLASGLSGDSVLDRG